MEKEDITHTDNRYIYYYDFPFSFSSVVLLFFLKYKRISIILIIFN